MDDTTLRSVASNLQDLEFCGSVLILILEDQPLHHDHWIVSAARSDLKGGKGLSRRREQTIQISSHQAIGVSITPRGFQSTGRLLADDQGEATIVPRDDRSSDLPARVPFLRQRWQLGVETRPEQAGIWG